VVESVTVLAKEEAADSARTGGAGAPENLEELSPQIRKKKHLATYQETSLD
jgi:hypothetical protein